MSNEVATITVSDISSMAGAIVASKLFGMRTKEEAMALMFIAQAEGLHPAIAARDYHIIQGRPTLKADAMLARFQTSGGKVEWHSYTDECCEATISHPQGGSVRVKWDMARVAQAQISNSAMYKKYPRNMLRARVISEGIRTVYPGVVVGVYTPEEADSMEPVKHEKAVEAQYTVVEPEKLDTPKTEQAQQKKEVPPELLKLAKEFSDYRQEIGLCDTSEKLEAVVKKNIKTMAALATQLPKRHAIITGLLNEKRDSFSKTGVAA